MLNFKKSIQDRIKTEKHGLTAAKNKSETSGVIIDESLIFWTENREGYFCCRKKGKLTQSY